MARPAVIILVLGITYANALHGPFIWDDQLTVLHNDSIREWQRLTRVLAPERELPVAGRPLVNLTFALNYAAGGLRVEGYHAVNIGLHIACALLLFGVVRRACALPAVSAHLRAAPNIALATALLWGAHPLNTEAVNYVTQRTELMMALFYLATLYSSIRALAARGRLWPVLSVAACAAGMACKESMVTAPVIVVLFDRVLVFDSFAAAFRARGRFYASLAGTWLVLGALMLSGPRIHSAGFGSRVSTWVYLLNQTEVITHYLRQAVWPDALVSVYGWPRPVTLGEVAPYAFVVVGLLAATCLAVARRPLLGFLGAWVFITLAPTSSIIPIATVVGAERRMYLPLMALAVLCVVAIARWRRAFVPVTAVFVAALATMTVARNREYASPALLAKTAVDRRPSDVARHFYGVGLLEEGRRDEGIAQLRLATASHPWAHYDLGRAYFSSGELEAAIRELDAFVQREPMLLEVINARVLMGRAHVRLGQWDQAIEQARELLKIAPSNVDGRAVLGHAFYGKQDYDSAIRELQRFLRARPSDRGALANLGVSLVATGKVAEAIDVFRRLVEVDPTNPDAHRNLALAYYDHGELAKAAAQARQGLALRPGDPVMRNVLQQATSSGRQ